MEFKDVRTANEFQCLKKIQEPLIENFTTKKNWKQLEKDLDPKILDNTPFMVTYWHISYVTEDKSEYERLCT